jgi:hypothetical protein
VNYSAIQQHGRTKQHHGNSFQKALIPSVAASPERPRLNLLIPPSSSISRPPLRSSSPPSPYNAGDVQRSATKIQQNGLIRSSSDEESDESDKSDELSFANLWEWNHRRKPKNDADTGMGLYFC